LRLNIILKTILRAQKGKLRDPLSVIAGLLSVSTAEESSTDPSTASSTLCGSKGTRMTKKASSSSKPRRSLASTASVRPQETKAVTTWFATPSPFPHFCNDIFSYTYTAQHRPAVKKWEVVEVNGVGCAEETGPLMAQTQVAISVATFMRVRR